MYKFASAFLVALTLSVSLSAAADSSHALKLNAHLIFDHQAVRFLSKADENKIHTALRLMEAFPPAADAIIETEPSIFITKTDSAWTEANLAEEILVGTTMKLLDPHDPYRIVLFWDRVQQDPYPVLRMSLSFLEIYNEMNPFNLHHPSDVIGDNLERMYRRIEFLGQTQLSAHYRRLDGSSKYALNQYLNIFQAQMRARIDSQRATREMLFGNCQKWLN